MVHDAVLAGAGAALLPKLLVAGDIEAGRLVCGELMPVRLWKSGRCKALRK
ncbi:MAG: hypothetical protein JF620_11465 [Mesorhizobium sp.]|nr:hypothetical protein [Mesorhizobium sp.]